MRRWLAMSAFCLVASAVHAAPARLVVLELFTSQSCSSCPPADALMAEFARTRTDVLPLDFHVDYWNRLSWVDPYSSREATGRQQDYAQALGSEVFTPQLLIDGARQVVGSDREAVEEAVAQARAKQAAGPAVAVSPASAGRVGVDLGAGAGRGAVLLVGYDSEHTTQVGAGENGGRTLHEANVVRSWRRIGTWDGAAIHLEAAKGAGEHWAALVQTSAGVVLGAAILP